MHRGAVLTGGIWLLGACATPGPPEGARFTSNREPPDAYECVAGRLRLEGFEIVESSAEDRTALALRRSDAGPDAGGPEWWRVEISVPRDGQGRTVVESVAGAAPDRDGPYAAPPARLQGVIGKLSASCTW